MGLGHIHRLLALGEVLRDVFICKFIVRSPLPGVRKLIGECCDELIELTELNENAELEMLTSLLTGKDIVVLDGYQFSTEYQKMLKQSGGRLICIDDVHNIHFIADVVFNSAGGVEESMYSIEPYTRLFLGPTFAMIKKAFLQVAGARRIDGPESLLICMGGADPENHTLSTLKLCLNYSFDSYTVVVGEAYRHLDELQDTVRVTGKEVKILRNITPDDLADCMINCAVAVCAASGIAYEYLCVGGELYIKETASNQAHLYSYLTAEGLAFRFDEFRVSRMQVASSLKKQKEIFDGKSGIRILKIFNGLDYALNVAVRHVNINDLAIIFEWVNEPVLRQQSFNPTPITLQDHSNWFNKKISDPLNYFYIFEYKNTPVAQLRFDTGEEAVISYSIDKKYRGRGWGTLVLQSGIELFRDECQETIPVVGYIKAGNENSHRVFKGLGFKQSRSEKYPNAFKYEYSTR
jgi:spore coat polysaccharide biosynthesis predicted glycosyltransferase SpsG/L-amino acid N-acyltransferase YncA